MYTFKSTGANRLWSDHYILVGTKDTEWVSQGFRKGHIRADLLTDAVNNWVLAQDRKMHTAIVFIDLSKAFDNISSCFANCNSVEKGGLSTCLVLELRVSMLPKWYAQWLIIRVLLLIKRCSPGERPWTVTPQHLCCRTSINCWAALCITAIICR